MKDIQLFNEPINHQSNLHWKRKLGSAVRVSITTSRWLRRRACI